jgi:hypothetical protein
MQTRLVRLRWPSPAMVVACVALMVALAPSSYATAVAQFFPRDSVGTAQLKRNSVTSDKVRDFTLRAWDFKRGDLPRGPAGPQGPAGVVGDVIVRQSSTTVPAATPGNGLYVTRSIQIRCEAGERAISGGTTWSSDANEEELITVYSRPLVENGKPVGWRARGGSDIGRDRIFTVEVLCAKG